MIKNVLVFILISNCWCLLWCFPTRDLPEGVTIVRDERQKSTDSRGGNIHLKFDGLVVAVPVETNQLEDGAEFVGGVVLEAILGGGLIHKPQHLSDEDIPSITLDNVQTTEDFTDSETTTMNAYTETSAP